MQEDAMLVLSRRVGEKIMIGEGITVVVSRVSGDRVTLGLQAPADVRIVRGELQLFADDADQAELPTVPDRWRSAVNAAARNRAAAAKIGVIKLNRPQSQAECRPAMARRAR
jgi:carbon storage regulator